MESLFPERGCGGSGRFRTQDSAPPHLGAGSVQFRYLRPRPIPTLALAPLSRDVRLLSRGMMGES